MSDEAVGAQRSSAPRALIAVVDTSVLVSRRHVAPIIEAAHDGYVVPVWSPCIISEAVRVLTWRWLRSQPREPRALGGDVSLTRQLEAACSRDAKVWFGVMTEVFRVVEDRPPDERVWAAEVRDPDDLPIWNAAVRSSADFIVTSNLRDGPPVDTYGRQTFDGVTFVGPEDFAAVLVHWGALVSTGAPPDGGDSPLPEPLRELVDEMQSRDADPSEQTVGSGE